MFSYEQFGDQDQEDPGDRGNPADCGDLGDCLRAACIEKHSKTEQNITKS